MAIDATEHQSVTPSRLRRRLRDQRSDALRGARRRRCDAPLFQYCLKLNIVSIRTLTWRIHANLFPLDIRLHRRRHHLLLWDRLPDSTQDSMFLAPEKNIRLRAGCFAGLAGNINRLYEQIEKSNRASTRASLSPCENFTRS